MQIIFSSKPLWAAGLAMLLLGGDSEAVGPMTWLGGLLLVSAGITASTAPAQDPQQALQQQQQQRQKQQRGGQPEVRWQLGEAWAAARAAAEGLLAPPGAQLQPRFAHTLGLSLSLAATIAAGLYFAPLGLAL